MFEITSFADPVRVVYRCHRALKSSRDSKIMGYNPQKRLEMDENTTFTDPSRVVYLGSQGIEILPGLENYGL